MNAGTIEISSIMNKINEIIIPKAQAKGLTCTIKIKKELPHEMICDFKRLLQVIYNVSFNSIKYTFKGKIVIKLSLSDDKNNFCIKISDTGIGISKKDLENINRLFGLLDQNLLQNRTGIGLGLLVTKCILNTMNGTIDISSKQNIGTKCKIVIPFLSPIQLSSLVNFMFIKE